MTVSEAASWITAVAPAMFVELVAFALVHASDCRCQPAGTSSVTCHGATPGVVSARMKVALAGALLFTASRKSPDAL